MNSEQYRKLFKVGLTLTCSAFRFPHGDESSVQGFQFYVLKYFPLSKRIFEGFELVVFQKGYICVYNGLLGAPRRARKVLKGVHIGQLDHYVVFGTKFGAAQDFQ